MRLPPPLCRLRGRTDRRPHLDPRADSETQKFTTECANEQLKAVGLSTEQIDTCMGDYVRCRAPRPTTNGARLTSLCAPPARVCVCVCRGRTRTRRTTACSRRWS